MTDPQSIAAGPIISSANKLAHELLKAGAGRLEDLAVSDDEQQALTGVLECAFINFMQTMVPDLDDKTAAFLDSPLRCFLNDPDAAAHLFDIVLQRDPPNTALLRTRFHVLYWDPDSLAIDFHDAMRHLLAALDKCLHDEVTRPGSPLFNRYTVGQREALRRDVQMRTPTTQIRITIDMDIESFTDRILDWLLYGLAGFLKISPDAIHIAEVEPGSVEVTVQLALMSAQRLIDAFEQDDPALRRRLFPLHILNVKPMPHPFELEPALVSLDTMSRAEQQALERYYQNAGAVTRQNAGRAMEAAVGSNLAMAHAAWGDAQSAIDDYERARASAGHLPAHPTQFKIARGLGLQHAALGNHAQAIAYFGQTMDIARALDVRYELYLPRLPFEPELVPIPAGPFLMGSSEDDPYAEDDEKPQHTVHLDAYLIGRYPVTNAQYAAFVQATGHRTPEHWPDDRLPQDLADHPVVSVTWNDAQAYVAWLRKRTGWPYRLPTEAEWQKAARGIDARLWPWRHHWDPRRCNSSEGGPGTTTPVGQYSPAGDSPYGCADMAGNVWEWTCTLWGKDLEKPEFEYPYNPKDGRENLEAGDEVRRVLCGGSFFNIGRYVRCAYRGRLNPSDRLNLVGVRVVVAPVDL